MVHLATAEDRIREVWATNLEDEFKEICKVGVGQLLHLIVKYWNNFFFVKGSLHKVKKI